MDTRRILHRAKWGDRILVVTEEGRERLLSFGNHMIQSRMDMVCPHALRLPYTRFLLGCLLLLTTPRKVLIFGLGGGSMVRFLLHHCPGCQLEVVEHCPEVLDIARRFFLLPDDPRLLIHLAEGGDFLLGLPSPPREGRFDTIILDAFDHQTMAASVYARHIFRVARHNLTANGLLILNLSSRMDDYYRAIMRELTEIFPESTLQLPLPGSHNVIALAFKGGLPAKGALHPSAHLKLMAEAMDIDFFDIFSRLARANRELWH
ncbi:MAG: spermidine synthase [Magnetococcales bacterium]|nr:spermidine synthase [Magnetococcales bacterium]